VLVLGLALFCAVSVVPIYRAGSPVAVGLMLLPVSAAGWFFGLRAGLLAGVLVAATHTLLFWLVREPAPLLMILHKWPGVLATLGAGLAAGWLGTRLDYLRDQAGKLAGERETLRMGLRFSEARFRLFMDHSPVMVFFQDESGRFLYFNKQVEDFLQRPLADCQGKTVFELFPAEIAQPLWDHDRQALAANRPMTFSESIPDCEDVSHDWLVVRFPFRDEPGQRFIGGVAQDVTELRRTEAVLRESERRHRSLVETVASVIVCLSADHRIVEFNREAERVFGWPKEEVSGKDYLDCFVHERARAEAVAALRSVSAGETIFGVEYPVQTRNSGERVLLWNYTQLTDDAGQPVGVIMSGQDITERKARGELRQCVFEEVVAAQEEERRRVARELHDGVSQQLAALSLRLSLVEFAPTPQEAREHIEKLRGICTATATEVRRLARGLHPAVLDDLGLAPALERYAEDYKKVFGINIDVHFLALVPGRVPRPAEVTLYRVIQEALTNTARHACATTVSVVVEHREGLVRAIVEDDGKGFDSQSFLQSAARSGHLGLSGMQERVALLRGLVGIESQPGLGTTISISIPLGDSHD
jgi:PAS domain S-box-containing protein